MKPIHLFACLAIFAAGCKQESKTTTQAARGTTQDTASAPSCKPLFVISKKPFGAEDLKQELICHTDEDNYHVMQDPGISVDDQLKWNRKYEGFIDFRASRQYILDAHPGPEDANTLSYTFIPAAELRSQIDPMAFRNTYNHFCTLGIKDGVVKAQVIFDHRSRNDIFSMPFLIALLEKYPDQPIGIRKTGSSILIQAGSDYYNISNAPNTKVN